MGHDKLTSEADTSLSNRYTPKFSPEQQSFLDITHQYAIAVKPLSLKIFLYLLSEDEELLSKEFPQKSKDTIEAEIDGMLVNPTFKKLLSTHLAKQDYSAALISVITLIMASSSISAVGSPASIVLCERCETHTQPPPVEVVQKSQDKAETSDTGTNGHNPYRLAPEQELFLNLVSQYGAVKPLSPQAFLNLVAEDDNLLSRLLPERAKESVKAEVDGLLSNSSFKRELSAHLERQDYLAALISTTTSIGVPSPDAGFGAPPHGIPLEQLQDSCSKGLYHLYDLLWNRQENIAVQHTVMVPNLPSGYINYGQSAPTAVLPESFGKRPEPFSYDSLTLPDNSDAILPANDKLLKKVLVRSCYQAILTELELDSHHAVILGQPGTGKSCLLTYILAKRLFKRQPTILHLDEDNVYFFNMSGAIRLPNYGNLDEALLCDVWLLVDCDEDRSSLPNVTPSFLQVQSFKAIQAISPRNGRHKPWSKQFIAKELWVNTNSWEEYYVLGSAEFITLPIGGEKWAFSYLKYGSNPQIGQLTASSLAHDTRHLNHIQDELAALSVVTFPGASTSSPLLHAIIAPDCSNSSYTVVPASPHIAGLLYQHACLRGSESSHLADFRIRWKAVGSVTRTFATWGIHGLSSERGQHNAILSQVPPKDELNFYFNEIIKFANLRQLYNAINLNCKLLVPDTAFPVDAIMFNRPNGPYWFILVTAGEDYVVDGKALQELISDFSYGHQEYWRFLLVVPEQCDHAENIRVDIHGGGTAYAKLEEMPRYVLRL